MFNVVYSGNNYGMRTFYKLPNSLEIDSWNYLPSQDGLSFSMFCGVSQFQRRLLGNQCFAMFILPICFNLLHDYILIELSNVLIRDSVQRTNNIISLSYFKTITYLKQLNAPWQLS